MLPQIRTWGRKAAAFLPPFILGHVEARRLDLSILCATYALYPHPSTLVYRPHVRKQILREDAVSHLREDARAAPLNHTTYER